MNGFMYTCQRKSENGKSSQWMCVKNKQLSCKGRLKISYNEDRADETGAHNHMPNVAECKASMATASVKRRAEDEPHTSALHITQAVYGTADDETLAALPKEASLKRSIRRTRRENQPNLPKSFAELQEIPENYTELDGGSILAFDSEPGERRVIILGSLPAFEDMSRSDMWFCDGTFKSTPEIISQLYTIHYQKHENVILGCVALMADKSEESYKILFQELKNLLPAGRRSGPSRISMDFEIAAMHAFKQVFPLATENYCFFHFSQSMWRKAQNSGIATLYSTDEAIRTQFHSVLGLAFIPEDHVVNAFLELKENSRAEMDDILDLVEDYYILGRRRGRGRQTPRYPIETWNVVARTVRGAPRTNNSVEAWNRRWNALIGKPHPNIFEFLLALKKEIEYSTSQRILLEHGNSPPRKRAKYMKTDDRLQRLTERLIERLDDGGINYLEHLQAVGLQARGTFD